MIQHRVPIGSPESTRTPDVSHWLKRDPEVSTRRRRGEREMAEGIHRTVALVASVRDGNEVVVRPTEQEG